MSSSHEFTPSFLSVKQITEEYDGPMKIRRLLYLGEHDQSSCLEAFKQVMLALKTNPIKQSTTTAATTSSSSSTSNSTSASSTLNNTNQDVLHTFPALNVMPSYSISLYEQALNRIVETLFTPLSSDSNANLASPAHKNEKSFPPTSAVSLLDASVLNNPNTIWATLTAHLSAEEKSEYLELFTSDEGFRTARNQQYQTALNDFNERVLQARRESDKYAIFKALYEIALVKIRFGDHAGAFRTLLEAKELAHDEIEIINICIYLIKCAIHLDDYSSCKHFVQRIRTFIPASHPTASSSSSSSSSSASSATAELEPKHQALSCFIEAVMALSHIKNGAYQSAALSLLSYASSFSVFASTTFLRDVLNVREAASYSIVCILSSFSRLDIKTQILVENVAFKKLLDHAASTHHKVVADPKTQPSIAFKDLLQKYVFGEYSSLFAQLNTLLKGDLALDPYFAYHAFRVAKIIRETVLIQYFKAYSTVSLQNMSKSFGMEISVLESSIADLIVQQKIHARIDSQSKIVYARNSDRRVHTYSTALHLGDSYCRDVRSTLMRVSLQKAGIASGAVNYLKDNFDDIDPMEDVQ